MSETPSKPDFASLVFQKTMTDDEQQPGEDEDEDFDLDEEDEDEAEVQAAPPPAPAREPIQAVREGVVKRRGRPRKVQTQEAAVTFPAKPKKGDVLSEIPRDEIITKLEGQYSEVRLEITRQAPSGQWATVRGGILLPPAGLFDLQGPVTSFAGGGTFIYCVTDPNTKQVLVSRWKEIYDGRAIEAKKGFTLAWDAVLGSLKIIQDTRNLGVVDDGPPMGGPQYAGVFQGPNPFGPNGAMPPGMQPQYAPNGQMLPPPPELVPKFLQYYPASHQWQHVQTEMASKAGQQQQVQAAGVALDWTQDNLRQIGHLQAERARFEERMARSTETFKAEFDKLRAEMQAKVDQAAERASKAERELETSRVEARYAALEARLDAAAQRPPPPPDQLMPSLVSLAGVLVPLMIESRRGDAELAKTDRENQTKLLATVMSKPAPDTMAPLINLFSTIAPIAMPLVLEHLKSNSPKMQAEVLTIEHEQRMMMLKMMSDMVKESMPEAPPVWAPILEMGMQWLGQTMAARQLAASGARQLPAQPQQMAPGRPAQPQQQSQDATVAPGPSPIDQIFQEFASLDADAAAMTKLVWQNLPPNLGFHSHEWLVILFNLHARLEVEEIAETITLHLYHCQKFNLLPPQLKGVFDEGQTEATMRTVFDRLPIYGKDPEYCNAVLKQVTALIEESEREDEDEDDEVEEGEVVEATASA